MGTPPSAGGGRKRSLVKRAGLRAASHLVRHHPGAALSAVGAGLGYAVKEVARDSLSGARQIRERVRASAKSKLHGRRLARAYDRRELEILADLRQSGRSDDASR